MRQAVIALLLMAPAFAHAEETGRADTAVFACDDARRIGCLAEPWEHRHVRYAQGAVGVALLDGGEAMGKRLLILSPPRDDTNRRQCRIVAADEAGRGYGNIDFAGITSHYAPGIGLTLGSDVAGRALGGADAGQYMRAVRIHRQAGSTLLQGMT